MLAVFRHLYNTSVEFPFIVLNIPVSYDFPKGIIRIHYENLAFYPINMTMQIYKYLNLSFSLHIEKSVLNMTSSGKKEYLITYIHC
jgi:hypothetical protein